MGEGRGKRAAGGRRSRTQAEGASHLTEWEDDLIVDDDRDGAKEDGLGEAKGVEAVAGGGDGEDGGEHQRLVVVVHRILVIAASDDHVLAVVKHLERRSGGIAAIAFETQQKVPPTLSGL